MFMMDQSLARFSGCSNGDEANDELAFALSGEELRARLSIVDVPPDQNGNQMTFSAPNLGMSCEVQSIDPDCDFNDVVFQYISQMLMEEDVGENICVLQESSALEATEKSLYEAIGETYPPKGYSPVSESPSEGCALSSISDSSFDPNSEPKAELHDHFVPGIASLSMHSSTLLLDSSKQGLSELARKYPSNGVSVLLNTDVSRGKRNSYSEEISSEEEQQGRTNKQSAVYTEPEESSEMLDMVLLNGTNGESALRQSWKDGQMQGSNSKVRGKKKGRKKEVVDLRTLLTLCAQAVAAGNQMSAAELLKKIRLHASVSGDGMQRMAYYMADGLEARMAGSGSQIYRSLMYQPISSTRTLKAYQLFQTACPFKKLSNFFSNMTIMNAAEKASKIHIIDFGIGYGFQWPCLIRRLSSRQDGPPMVRITGIDNPQPGFRPAQKIDETGNRLKNYAEKFKVPFRFNAVAKKWDTISVEDLRLDADEVLIVNSIYRFKNLLDETVVAERSPRDTVLSLIRQTNPDIFIHGIVNAAHNAPLFVQRFRETLFHFSALFDMLEINVPRNVLERALIEKEIFGRQALNIIACEGPERVERPQTYKQWQLRNIRAGFTPLPLDGGIVRTAKDRVKTYYHKDFVIEEDGNWLLQGWKGRLVYGLSTWRPQN